MSFHLICCGLLGCAFAAAALGNSQLMLLFTNCAILETCQQQQQQQQLDCVKLKFLVNRMP